MGVVRLKMKFQQKTTPKIGLKNDFYNASQLYWTIYSKLLDLLTDFFYFFMFVNYSG